MNLTEHYNQLYKASINKISSDVYEIDSLIDSDNDDRFGLSLIIRPPISVKNEIQKFLIDLKSIAPDQYFYPNSDIHITVISIISCYSGLKLSQINLPKYVEIIEECFKNLQNITISCKGITASPSCIMIQGFIDDNSLNHLRDDLRSAFKNSELEQSMDERYLIQTAHATVFRFRAELEQKQRFLEVLENYRNYDFGRFKLENIELVYNDWYHRERLSEKLHEFKMKKYLADI